MRKFIIFLFYLINCCSSYCYAQRVPITFKFEQPVAGETYYLYNVGYEGFLCGANIYSTQASLSKTNGWKVRVNPHISKGQKWDGKTVLIEDSIETGSFGGCFRNMFIESNGIVYTDQAEKTLFRDNLWFLIERDKEKHTYNISLSMYNRVFTPESSSDYILGYDYNIKNLSPAVILCNPKANVAIAEWGFISEKEFVRKWDEHCLYIKSKELKTLIDSVDKTLPTVDTNVAKSVYLNPKSKKEEILNQIGIMRSALYSQGKESSAISFTSLILNPNFDMDASNTWQMKYDVVSGSITWQGGLYPNYCAEAYQTIFDFNQYIEGIPNGVYRMDVQAYYRTRTPDLAWLERDTAYVVTEIYANAFTRPVHNLMQKTLEDKNGQIDYLKENGILRQAPYGVNSLTFKNIDGSYVPVNMSGESLVFQNGLYDQSLYFIVNDGTATIGIRQDKKRTGCWSAWDNFRLYYLGNSVEAYRSALNGKIASSRNLVASTNLLGLDNTHLISALAEIDTNIDNADISKLYSYMAELQTKEDVLRKAWKQHEFNDVQTIGGYGDKYDMSIRDREAAERDKYLELAQSTFDLACKSIENKPETAIFLFKKVIEFAEKDSVSESIIQKELIYNSNRNLGYLYLKLEDLTNAELHYISADTALAYLCKIEYDRYNKNRAYLFDMLACIYLETRKLVEAVLCINKSITLDPTEAIHYSIKGEILLKQGKNEEALTMWKKVLELNPNFLDDYPNATNLSNGLKKLRLID